MRWTYKILIVMFAVLTFLSPITVGKSDTAAAIEISNVPVIEPIQPQQEIVQAAPQVQNNEVTELNATSLSRDATPYNDDIYWLSRVVSAEARGEPIEGQIAVANVVLNRARINGLTVREVVFAKNQFESVTNKSIYKDPTEQSYKSAMEALNGKKIVSEEVYYFYDPRYTSKKNWIRSRKIYKVIGDHRFCYQ